MSRRSAAAEPDGRCPAVGATGILTVEPRQLVGHLVELIAQSADQLHRLGRVDFVHGGIVAPLAVFAGVTGCAIGNLPQQNARSALQYVTATPCSDPLANLGRVDDRAVERRLRSPSGQQLALIAEFLALDALTVVGVRRVRSPANTPPRRSPREAARCRHRRKTRSRPCPGRCARF